MATALIVIALIPTIVDMISRNLFNQPIRGTIEYSEVLLVLIVSSGLGYAGYVDGHVSTDAVVSRVRPNRALWMEVFGLSVGIVLVALVTVSSAQLSIQAYQDNLTRSGSLRIWLWPTRAMISLGYALWGAALAWRIGRLLKGEHPDRPYGDISLPPDESTTQSD